MRRKEFFLSAGKLYKAFVENLERVNMPVEQKYICFPGMSSVDDDFTSIPIAFHEGVHHLNGFELGNIGYYWVETDKLRSIVDLPPVLPILEYRDALKHLSKLLKYDGYIIRNAKNNNTVFTLIDEWNAYSAELQLRLLMWGNKTCPQSKKGEYAESQLELMVLVAESFVYLEKNDPSKLEAISGNMKMKKLITDLLQRTDLGIEKSKTYPCLSGFNAEVNLQSLSKLAKQNLIRIFKL